MWKYIRASCLNILLCVPASFLPICGLWSVCFMFVCAERTGGRVLLFPLMTRLRLASGVVCWPRSTRKNCSLFHSYLGAFVWLLNCLILFHFRLATLILRVIQPPLNASRRLQLCQLKCIQTKRGRSCMHRHHHACRA